MSSNTPPGRLHQHYYRNGQSHRDGADVSFHDIRRMFGFQSITIGRWVTAKEQQIAANLFFDALYDLIDILQINEQVVSLNGSLSLAFGTGGQKNANAHYHPAKRQLALAKNAGGGALAHEWFHAFDHYISQKFLVRPHPTAFASQGWLDDADLVDHPLNHKLAACFQILFLSADGHSPNEYVLRSVEADKALKCFYFATPQELAARAFEACIQDQTIKNVFLVQGTKMSAEARLGIYPHGTLRSQLNDAFRVYFYQLGMALSAK
ncbi:hypothetical protein SAMN05216361_4245 [Marisediminitalea aggregata]|uniref:Large polyvalent protein-associated domain-containing protein n=1 Tax=Marisediminitalea aggregata TaxID=634436 RepID=A0A1M5RUZ5_9ALTE|nr:CLCA_X family protein [Marisediminitalea aggregata]SHH29989.1 hypothetical protein SAMN05216361_4245 [Marisediminitalea aggregata]